VKKFSPAFVLLIVSFFIVLFSCKKINEPTELGGDILPDNLNTFELSLNTVTKNLLTNDSARVNYYDQVALGDINDPEFGNVHANFCLSFASPVYGSYPFLPKMDTIHTIDSVVLSLAYSGAYGDTLGNGVQNISVYEIDPGSTFRPDTSYRYNDPASDFSGTLLGTKTYTITRLKDTQYIKEPGDTGANFTKYANVVRVRLNNSLGTKLASFDTTSGSSNAGYYSDSVFRKLFKGLAVKSANSGNALAYFDLASANTKLTIYHRYKLGSRDTTVAVSFAHPVYPKNNSTYQGGQSNFVNVQPGASWASALNNTAADKVYIQSSPSGSYASIVIPFLDTLSNKVIHRAEIIATRVASAGDNIFTPPPRLLLDRRRVAAKDSSLIFEKDLQIGSDLSIGYGSFGGTLSNNAYRFNITRYVQGIITKQERIDTLRLWAPLEAFESNAVYYSPNSPIPVNTRVAEGRVVLAGGTYPDPKTRLRLRIVYSNL
jgi:hypothetical protein